MCTVGIELYFMVLCPLPLSLFLLVPSSRVLRHNLLPFASQVKGFPTDSTEQTVMDGGSAGASRSILLGPATFNALTAVSVSAEFSFVWLRV